MGNILHAMPEAEELPVRAVAVRQVRCTQESERGTAQQERQDLFYRRKVTMGDILRQARLDKGLGTRMLAAMSGLRVCTIRQIESGRQECTTDVLRRLCDALDNC